jgi:hypothetical protein
MSPYNSPQENQRLDNRKKPTESSTIGSIYPLININVLPVGSPQQSIYPPDNDAMPTGPDYTESIMVDGLLDVAVEEYTEWQESRVSNETSRENIDKARDVTLGCLDLMHIYKDQDPGFYVKHGV